MKTARRGRCRRVKVARRLRHSVLSKVPEVWEEAAGEELAVGRARNCVNATVPPCSFLLMLLGVKSLSNLHPPSINCYLSSLLLLQLVHQCLDNPHQSFTFKVHCYRQPIVYSIASRPPSFATLFVLVTHLPTIPPTNWPPQSSSICPDHFKSHVTILLQSRRSFIHEHPISLCRPIPQLPRRSLAQRWPIHLLA